MTNLCFLHNANINIGSTKWQVCATYAIISFMYFLFNIYSLQRALWLFSTQSSICQTYEIHGSLRFQAAQTTHSHTEHTFHVKLMSVLPIKSLEDNLAPTQHHTFVLLSLRWRFRTHIHCLYDIRYPTVRLVVHTCIYRMCRCSTYACIVCHQVCGVRLFKLASVK